MDIEEKQREKADKAGKLIENLVESFRDIALDPDYAAYLFLTTGLGIAITNNRQSPIIVNQLLAAAMQITNSNIIEMEEKEEEEDDGETMH